MKNYFLVMEKEYILKNMILLILVKVNQIMQVLDLKIITLNGLVWKCQYQLILIISMKFKRWNNIDGNKVQRDLYSSFLIMNINNDLETYNLEKCNERFNNFLRLHKLEVKRLLENKNLSSIGI